MEMLGDHDQSVEMKTPEEVEEDHTVEMELLNQIKENNVILEKIMGNQGMHVAQAVNLMVEEVEIIQIVQIK